MKSITEKKILKPNTIKTELFKRLTKLTVL